MHLAETLLHLLSVLAEFWCQQHCKLNQKLVEKGLKDLSEHFAVLCTGKHNDKHTDIVTDCLISNALIM